VLGEHDGSDVAAGYDGLMSGKRFPATVKELEERLIGAAGPSEDDQSRTAGGEVLDTREAVERFLTEVERARPSRPDA
jgi:hypothetical protein